MSASVLLYRTRNVCCCLKNQTHSTNPQLFHHVHYAIWWKISADFLLQKAFFSKHCERFELFSIFLRCFYFLFNSFSSFSANNKSFDSILISSQNVSVIHKYGTQVEQQLQQQKLWHRANEKGSFQTHNFTKKKFSSF